MFKRLLGQSGEKTGADLPTVAEDERVYAIGDIHGRADLLEALLERIELDIAQTDDDRFVRIIFLGDYIDRGDHSKDVIDTLKRLRNTPSRRYETLLGNHEQALIKFLEDPVAYPEWIDWGGRQTLASYGVPAISREPDSTELAAMRDAMLTEIAPHLDFLKSLKRMTVSGTIAFAHASLDQNHPIDAQPDTALLWGHTASGGPESLSGYGLVHGHFAAVEPVSTPARICVDTGAYYSGRLTAVRLDEARTFLGVDVLDVMP